MLKNHKLYNTYCNLIDANWYESRYFQTLSLNDNALSHFSLNGKSGAFDPNPLFHAKAYKENYIGQRWRGTNLLEHYIKEGEAKGCNPNPIFNPLWYRANNPDLVKPNINLLEHFIYYGSKEGRNPNRHFDTKWYLNTYSEILLKESNPLAHFLLNGYTGKFNPNPYFDSQWYIKEYLSESHKDINPLVHYLEFGANNGYSPHPNLTHEEYKRFLSCDVYEPTPYALMDSYKAFRLVNNKYNFREVRLIKDILSSLPPSLYPLRSIINFPIIASEEFDKKFNFESESFNQNFDYQPTSLARVEYPTAPKIKQFNNIFLIGGSRYVLTDQNYLINDEVAYFYNNNQAYIKSNFGIKVSNTRLAIEVNLRQSTWVDEGINLMHEYNTNYFHFICETLPRMVLVDEAGIDKKMPYLLEDNLHKNIYALFNLVNQNHRKLIKLIPQNFYRVKKLFQPSDLSCIIDVYHDDPLKKQSVFDLPRITAAVEKCKTQILITEGAWKAKKRRIFVGRRGGMRGLTNQAVIERELLKIGFETIYTESLDLETQIQIFNQAEVIIGPTGAQMTNIIWCQPKTKIFILASDHAAHQLQMWNFLSKISNSSVEIIQAPRAFNLNGLYSLHDDYTLDNNQLHSLLDQLNSL